MAIFRQRSYRFRDESGGSNKENNVKRLMAHCGILSGPAFSTVVRNMKRWIMIWIKDKSIDASNCEEKNRLD
ncbi:hypothetical protein J6590_054628 [Homalodisca vitripennis]|nr:hypothetical protein J6590_054628 [Homalodisca vitripennis]